MSDAKIILTSFVCLMLSGLAFLAGCDRRPAGPIKYPTKGIVTNDGKPVADARVVFYSTELNVSRTARTGADGRFTVRAGTGNGLQAGTYQVAVQAVAAPSDNPMAIVDDNRDDIPKIYRRKSTTPLTQTVADGDNLLEIDLSK